MGKLSAVLVHRWVNPATLISDDVALGENERRGFVRDSFFASSYFVPGFLLFCIGFGTIAFSYFSTFLLWPIGAIIALVGVVKMRTGSEIFTSNLVELAEDILDEDDR